MTPYLSRLTSDLDGGFLAALFGFSAVAIAFAIAAALLYGLPAISAWILPRWARWKSEQVRRASIPQEFPPKDDAVAWVGPLLVILPLVALVVAIMRCQGVGK